MKRILSAVFTIVLVLCMLLPAFANDTVQFTGSDDGISVSVTASEGTFPNNTEMSVSKVSADSSSVSVDISFYADGQKVEPNNEVSVSMDYTELDGEEFHVYHEGELIDTATSTNAEFTADSFSVYSIEAVKVDTYNFYDGEKLVSSQRVKTGETVYAPSRSENTAIFRGWKSDTKEYGDFTSFTVEEATGAVYNLYSVYEDSPIHVYYMSDNRILHTITGNKGDVVELTQEFPLPTEYDAVFDGWYLDEECTEPAPTEITLEKDMYLYAKYTQGHWIHFNTDGGTSIDPQFVLEETTEPTVIPEKAGYTFSGWYLNEEPYVFGSALTEDITLTAKWTPAETSYRVIIWQESVFDTVEEYNYDYYESYTVTGTTDETIVLDDSYTTMSFTGFEYAKTDGDETIRGDGSSVVNVYYNRKIITSRFWNSTAVGTGEVTELVGKYGTSFKTNGVTTPEPKEGYMWCFTENGRIVYTNLINIFTYTTSSSQITNINDYRQTQKRHYRYYTYYEGLYDLEDPNYSSADLTNFYDSGSVLTVGTPFIRGLYVKENYGGFTMYKVRLKSYRDTTHAYKELEVQPGIVDLYADLSDTSKPLIMYFKRRIFTINFINGSETTSKQALYDDDISDLEYTPECPYDGDYVFDGWYADEEYTEKFDFSNPMPANNLILYAKWTPAQYTIRVHSVDGDVIESTTVDYGTEIASAYFPSVICGDNVISKGNDTVYSIPADADWFGWIDSDNVAVIIGQKVTHDIDYYPYYIEANKYTIIYHSGEETAYADHVYSDGAIGKIDNCMFDEDSFLYWTDAQGNIYTPNEEYTFGTENLELYAVYSNIEKLQTKLIYHSDENTHTEVYSVNDEVEIKGAIFEKEGYTFKGWKDENGNMISGRVVLDGAENHLYAVWEKNKDNVPETGDNSFIILYVALAIISICGIKVLSVMRGR